MQNLIPQHPLSFKVRRNKATGYDNIPPRAIKESAEMLCYPFSILFNHLLKNSRTPQQWKLESHQFPKRIVARLTKSNYRPITILPSLSKIFETLIHSRISHYFNDIFHEDVFAYSKNHGTDTALLSLTEQWRKELDQHDIIGIVSMDLSKAFDTLPHDLKRGKIKSYGADDKTTELIHDYLTNRRQRVRLGDQLSNWKEISARVPQASVLGP